MVGFAVLSIAFVQRDGRPRADGDAGRKAGRPGEVAGGGLRYGVAAFIVAVLIPYSWDHFGRAFEFGDSTIDIELATWPAKLVVPVALSVLLLRLALQFGGYLRLVAGPDLTPVAVPSIKDAAERAQEEILLSEGDDPGARPAVTGLDDFWIGILGVGLLVLLVALGVRVYVAAALTGFLGLLALKGWSVAGAIAGTIPHSKTVTYPLSVLPLFILIGFLAFHAGLTTRLFRGGAALGRMGAGRPGGGDRLRERGPSPPCLAPRRPRPRCSRASRCRTCCAAATASA